MSRSLVALLALLPPGRAWTRALGTRLVNLATAIAAEFDRVRGRGEDLVREAVPTGADELLGDWEALTDATECVSGASLDARRAGVVSRLRAGTPTEELTTTTIDGMGYTPELTYWLPFQVGRSTVGEALSNDEWQHTIGITVSTHTPEDDAALRCVVEDLQHAHIFVQWTFEPDGVLLTESGDEITTEDGIPIAVE